MVADADLDTQELNIATYDWSVRVFRMVRKLLSVNLKLHSEQSEIENGDIFLFNHFARFETFIPQYLIYEETGAYCYSVASAEFFEGDETLANYLHSVGVVPHNHERLFPALARQILKGRKIIIFPEGGMVKDKNVIDSSGDYSVYSRIAESRRKHHTGAAVLALGLQVFKEKIRGAYNKGNNEKLKQWHNDLGFEDMGELLTAALRPTTIVPSNITFYPIRVGDNVLRQGAKLLNDGLTRRSSEELLIEGNILLKDTDMDIRLGAPVNPSDIWHTWDHWLINQITLKSLNDGFEMHRSLNPMNRLLASRIRKNAATLRDQYMDSMYRAVTVNLSHLASILVIESCIRGQHGIRRDVFHTTLYFAVKQVQRITSIHLHRSLKNPTAYADLIHGNNERIDQFMAMAESSALIEPSTESYHFLPKLLEVHGFDEIRMENLIAVYANEIAPRPKVAEAVRQAIGQAQSFTSRKLSELLFDDELTALRWDKGEYSKPWASEINSQETATQSAEPFLFEPIKSNGFGIVLVHGFLASPAETRSFGQRLSERGFTVLGARLKGHGTSPYDLRDQSWLDWFASVQNAYRIIQGYCEKIFLIGFSTGGALALRLAVDQPDELVGVVAVSVPIKFHDSSMMLIPLLHRANKLVRWISSLEGVKPFIQHNPEHTDVNYRNIPIRGLYELRSLISELSDHLKDVHYPTLVIQGDKDPVVEPTSADIIFNGLATKTKELLKVSSDRHGILMENIDQTEEKIIDFLNTQMNSLASSVI